MYSIKPVSNPPSSFKGESFDSTSIQPILTLLGWKDMQPALELAENQDRVLTQSLQHAYEAYHTAPNPISKLYLNAAINSMIEKLNADAHKAEQFAQAAALRLKQRETNRESTGYISGWMGSIKEGLQSLFSSDDTALVERYTALAESYQSKRAALETYRDGLLAETNDRKIGLQTIQSIEADKNAEGTHHRRLLLEETSLGFVQDKVVYVGEMYNFTINSLQLFGKSMQIMVEIKESNSTWLMSKTDFLTINYKSGGTSQKIIIRKGIAYIANGLSGLCILNVTNPALPALLTLHPTFGYAQKITLNYPLAYISTTGIGGLQIFNVSDPVCPKLVGMDDNFHSIADVVVSDSKIYVVDVGFLTTLSINEPFNITRLKSQYIPFQANTVVLRDDIISIGTTNGFFNYNLSSNMDAFNQNISLQAPVQLSNYTTALAATSIRVIGTTAYVGGGVGGSARGIVELIDVSNATHPHLISSYKTFGKVCEISVDGPISYVLEGCYWNGYGGGGTWNGLQIFDTSNYANITLLGSYSLGSDLTLGGLFITDGIAWITIFRPGHSLLLLNVTNPSSIKAIQKYVTPSCAFDVVVKGDIAYVAEGGASLSFFQGIQIVNVSNISNFTEIGRYSSSVSGSLGFPTRILLIGQIAYLIEMPYFDNGPSVISGLEILDISNPASPKLLGRYETLATSSGASIGIMGSIICIAQEGVWNGIDVKSGWNGFQVIDILKISDPKLLYNYSMPSGANDITVQGINAYVVTGNNLEIFSIADTPTNLALGGYIKEFSIIDMKAMGSILYLITSFPALQIFNNSNLVTPILLGELLHLI